MKPKRFFFHYNKPASKAAGYPKISLHYNDVCHVVDYLVVLVPTNSKFSSRQPRFVMQGWAKEVSINSNGVAVIE